ncbi:MAG: hypothetical protein KKE39_07205 [Bacteroidetes bacterium]|nr:hypothetical protein [Bacteroidota bacterium]MBU1373315.1 hypothetical protein [Bacteroidota bacterium]MBU1484406.1 hypothetical protein [Bacteroidota bacterium]MBU1762109.1 hypothetical protein [Bacteroidota bacterium]MBU2045972.1 hypothetical protein [Bacteroidota bacterium]
MKQSIYIQFEQYLFSRKVMLALLIASLSTALVAYVLNSTSAITELTAYYVYTLSSFLSVFSIYHLYTKKSTDYIYLTEDEIWFKEKDQNETICLKYAHLEYFETRFSEIIFCTKEEEKMVMTLNSIRDEKKRWEIKEFLRNHIRQIRDQKMTLLASA